MQPYFLPYIGYFQLLEHCDMFVLYDDIEYTKRGWINRNRILVSGSPHTITLPLRRASDFLDVRDREIASEYSGKKMLAAFEQSYRRAPYWTRCKPMLEEILHFPNHNLFDFVEHSILVTAACVGIATDVVVSSTLGIDRSLRGEERVLATCAAMGATEYVNPIGGLSLYRESEFAERGISLSFLQARLSPYPQYLSPYVEALSIVDTMMFVEPLELRARVRGDFEIVTK
jgi:WbqC-like protein family